VRPRGAAVTGEPWDGACSTLSRSRDEPLAGSAPEARAWVVIEQPGPWGRDALTASHLDQDVARTVAARADGLPVRVQLARRPGAHPDARSDARTVWTAFSAPGRSWLRSHEVASARALLDLDLEALAGGEPAGAGDTVEHPMIFVCTNARRDRCCALRGRPLAAALAARHHGRVWECSHLGGHRFAPTALTLPAGVLHGRLGPDHAFRVLEEARQGRLVLDGYRGRSCWARPGQVAEAEVRRLTGERGLDALDVLATDGEDDGRWRVEVAAADGRGWSARVVEQRGGDPAPESCGKAPVVPRRLVVEDLTAHG